MFKEVNDLSSSPRDGRLLPSSLSASVIAQSAVMVWEDHYLHRNEAEKKSVSKHCLLSTLQCQGSLCAVGMSALQWALTSGLWVIWMVLHNPLCPPTCPGFFAWKEVCEGRADVGSAACTWVWGSQGPWSRHRWSLADRPQECRDTRCCCLGSGSF